MSDEKDFRGKLLFDKSYSYRSQFVEQRPIADLLPDLEHAFANGVKAIKWQQFIPGFNDGDPCEFTINEVFFTSNEKIANLWINDDRADNLEDSEDHYPDADYVEDWSFALGHGHLDGLTHDVDVPIGSSEFEYALRAEFGDDVTVVITPESTYKFDYDCGY